jgi:hypothetical protein
MSETTSETKVQAGASPEERKETNSLDSTTWKTNAAMEHDYFELGKSTT